MAHWNFNQWRRIVQFWPCPDSPPYLSPSTSKGLKQTLLCQYVYSQLAHSVFYLHTVFFASPQISFCEKVYCSTWWCLESCTLLGWLPGDHVCQVIKSEASIYIWPKSFVPSCHFYQMLKFSFLFILLLKIMWWKFEEQAISYIIVPSNLKSYEWFLFIWALCEIVLLFSLVYRCKSWKPLL